MRSIVRVVGAAIVAVVLVFPLANAGTTRAAGGLDVFICAGPYALVDHNKPGEEGPMVLTFCVGVTNTSGSTCELIDVYIGDGVTPGTFPLGTDATTSLSILGGVGEAHRFIPSLADGETKWLMWQVEYPATFDETYDLHVWAKSQDSNCDGSDSRQITTRASLTAAANKVLGTVTVNPPGGVVSAGNIVEVTITGFQFGQIGDGFGNEEDAWLQPMGNSTFDPSCFRLISTETVIASIDPPFTMPWLNRLYFPGIKSQNPPPNYSYTATDYVTYRFIAQAACSTAIQPYQEVASGQVQKYSFDYGRSGATIPLTSQGSAIDLDKEVSPLTAVVGDTLTWTIEYHNLTDLPVGDPSSGAGLVIIDQGIPAGTEYVATTADSSASSIISYSIDNGATWTVTEPSPASDVTMVKWYINETIPALGSGTVWFETLVTATNGPICNSATAQIGDSEVIAASDACANADDAEITVHKTVTLVEEVDCGGQISPGDTVEYLIEVSSVGTTSAQGLTFVDSPDTNTSLVVGSVVTDKGAVVEGNTAGDTEIEVHLGTLTVGSTAHVRYRVVLLDGDYPSISNQGLVTGANVVDTVSDDPTTEDEGDPTETPVYPVQPCPPPPRPQAVGGEAMQPDKLPLLAGPLLLLAVAGGVIVALRRIIATH